MKLSKNFVKDYIDIDVDIKTLAEDMTRVGNEYDSAEKLLENFNTSSNYVYLLMETDSSFNMAESFVSYK